MNPSLSWNLLEDVQVMLSYHFMLNALRAGTVVAVVAGAIGYLMVLRRESFAGHTLAVIGFPGAAIWARLTIGAGGRINGEMLTDPDHLITRGFTYPGQSGGGR